MKSAPWVLNASTGAGAALLVARFAVIRQLFPVNHRNAGGLRSAVNPSVDMFGHAADQVFGRFAQASRPILAYQIVIAADAAGGDDHGLGAQRELADDVARGAFSPLDIRRLE